MPLPQSGQDSSQQRLLQEARALACPSHPNIVPIYEVGQIDGQAFYVMEYIRGCSLDAALTGTPLDPKVVARLVRDLARGLQYAHDHGVIHRDIKPANILLRTEADLEEGSLTLAQWKSVEVTIVDFGLARQINRKATRLTYHSAVMGTPLYMSPEQARGEVNRVDACSDVFSLGMVFYELLTGILPYANLPIDSLLRVLGDSSQAVPPPSRFVRNIDPALEAVCVQALRKDPGQRYSSAAALADDLDRYLNGEKVNARWPSRRRLRAADTR